LNDNTTGELDALIGRLREGDPGARTQLIDRAARRLEFLVAKIVRESFPRLSGHEDTAMQESSLRLWSALESVRPPTQKDFFRFAAHKIRQTLFDLVERESRAAAIPPGSPESQTTYNPEKIAQWTEFHRAVERLPDDQREVFEMRFYNDLTNAEIADQLGTMPKAVSRLWIAATETLLESLPGVRNFF
jgi:RNA polymerase sigma factor (sigma-70 family)